MDFVAPLAPYPDAYFEVLDIVARPGSPIWAAGFISGSLTVLYEYVYC